MMLRRLPASMPPREVLDTPGFAWWYLDVVDTDGNGLVLIWSFGLPFLPDLGARAVERPSLNVAFYEGGRPAFYTLQELDASWDGDSFRFGRSVITTRREGGRWTLSADLDGDLPAGRFSGSVRATGHEVLAPEGGAGEHEWAILATGTADVNLEADGRRYRLRGRAYHDRNSSPRPLGELGIRQWLWGRIALPGGDLVFYEAVAPDERTEVHVLRVCEGGTRAGAPHLVASDRRSTVYGPSWPKRLEVDGIQVVLGPVLDQGPFYLRLLARSGDAMGFAEVVCADRVGRAAHKPFVRMAVQRETGNSMWLPLFAGPREGRIARLARWWMQ